MRFDYRKATQALNYFASRRGGSIGKLQAMKLIFFADRYHLRKYGRTVTEDAYLAMQYGPVPSLTMNIAGLNDFLERHEREYAARYIRPSEDHKRIHAEREPDLTVLSETDREALNAVWVRFMGTRNQVDLVELSHLFPEWKRHAAATGPGKRMPMNLEDFLLDDPAVAEFELVPLTAKERELRRGEISEAAAISAMLG
jgi:uncharacterized phage-associated protein